MTMTVEEAAEAAKGMTFEKVWLYMQETQRQFREVQQEIRGIQQADSEQSKELRQEIANLTKNIDNQSKNIGGINNSIGEITEAMFSPEIHKKFNAFGYNFKIDSTCTNKKFHDDNDQTIAEADIYLENGSIVMVIEVKTKLTQTDIDEHIERIETIKNHFNKKNDNRNILGAVASTVINDNLVQYAQKNGLFVLVQSGESVKIADLPENFKPKAW